MRCDVYHTSLLYRRDRHAFDVGPQTRDLWAVAKGDGIYTMNRLVQW